MNSETAGWNVLRTRSRQENVVERALLQKNISAFVPRFPKPKQNRAKSGKSSMPLFPGYVFVKPAPTQVYSLKFIPRSCGLLMGRNGPGVIRQQEMESINILLDSSLPIDLHGLMPGTPVRVVVGPLSGVEGELVRIRNQHRLVLNTTILGQAVSVEINADDVQKV
jgi:transcription antitermination factor NusG